MNARLTIPSLLKASALARLLRIWNPKLVAATRGLICQEPEVDLRDVLKGILMLLRKAGFSAVDVAEAVTASGFPRLVPGLMRFAARPLETNRGLLS